MPESDAVEAVRAFHRFYTPRIGLLDRGYLHSRFSLAEVRVLYEIAHRDEPSASGLGRSLQIDPGYLSRMLSRFERSGYVTRTRSEIDRRRSVLRLTKAGRRAFAPLESGARAQAGGMLAGLSADQQTRLIRAMHEIQTILGEPPSGAASYLLRPHSPGDIGWVIHRHGVIYAREYGWDERFEALVAEIATRFLRNFDPQRERCWIAERDGLRVGSVFLMKESPSVARLRLLLVEPEARGSGIGTRLVEECIAFARQAGYRKIVLWTQRVLRAAQRIYRQTGFQMVKEERHSEFGYDLIGQTWEKDLKAG